MHYASRNLNLVLKDAMRAMTETRQFYDKTESVHNFFGHSIVRWQKLQNLHDRSCSNPILKALNPTRTRWSGRYDVVDPLKERFCSVIKCLTYIILTSTKPKKQDEAMAIKKQIENFDFVCMLVVQCKILQIVNIPLKAMECKTIDLISAHKLLQAAAKDIVQLKKSFNAVLTEASTIASTWGFSELKLIKNFLLSSIFQERLSGLALLSIENERAKNLDFRKFIQQFASTKARRKIFKFSTTRK